MKRFLGVLCLMAVLFVNVAYADEITLSEALTGLNLGVSTNGTVSTVYLTEMGANGARGGIAGQAVSIKNETASEGEAMIVFGLMNNGELARTTTDEDTDTIYFYTDEEGAAVDVIVAAAYKYSIETANNGKIYYRPTGVACAWKTVDGDSITYILAGYQITGTMVSYPNCLYGTEIVQYVYEPYALEVERSNPVQRTIYRNVEAPENFAFAESESCNSDLAVGIRYSGGSKVLRATVWPDNNG